MFIIINRALIYVFSGINGFDQQFILSKLSKKNNIKPPLYMKYFYIVERYIYIYIYIYRTIYIYIY